MWRILDRLDLNRLPSFPDATRRPEKRWKRYEKPQPGHSCPGRRQVHHSRSAQPARRYYQFTAIDDCTRLRESSRSIREVQPEDRHPVPRLPPRTKLPFRVEVIQTDNGGEFGIPVPRTTSSIEASDTSTSNPPHPDSTARSNAPTGSIEEEFYRMLNGVVIDGTDLFNEKLQEWEDFYNFNRPHGGLDGQTPYERLKAKTTENPQV